MKTEKWLRVAADFNSELDRLGAALAAHQAAEPVAMRTDAADLHLAMQLKAEELSAKIKHNAETQRLIGKLLDVQRSMLKHLERAPPSILAQSQSIMEAAHGR